MNVKISILNNYAYDLALVPYCNGTLPSLVPTDLVTVISRKEAREVVNVNSGECAILEIPGLNSVLIQHLGTDKLIDCHDRFCESPDEFDLYEQSVLLRCANKEVYWRFANEVETAELEISVNSLGTVCIDNVIDGAVRAISLPELYISASDISVVN
ncbi:hypothetical protein [Pseudoalteromonas sp. SG44-8]|uniref:hypothetical protein n=1 Tax=Pseudoalteromonas sp. SG44-8 TaxID=2760958 RepID=UPI0016013B8C|nr:hypothetical protein [Pseudoalteromonas sp. SG44-8]MBB1396731.1 hypothetical protein [Pseudoalteromonas sp. SG44-8]